MGAEGFKRERESQPGLAEVLSALRKERPKAKLRFDAETGHEIQHIDDFRRDQLMAAMREELAKTEDFETAFARAFSSSAWREELDPEELPAYEFAVRDYFEKH